MMLSSSRLEPSLFRLALALAVGVGLGSFTAPALAATCPTEPVTIQLSFWGSANEKADIEHAVAHFNETRPCIHVNTLHIPYEGYVEKLTTMLAANTPPDVAYLPENPAFDWASKGRILDLSPYMGKNPELKFVRTSIYHAGDVLMGTGLATGVMLMYYNKDVFDAAGLPYPPAKADQAWTWDQFVKITQKLTKDRAGKTADQEGFNPNDIDTYGVAMPLQWWGGWLPYVISNGGEMASEDGKTLLLNQPKAVEALQRLQDLIYKYHVMPTPTSTNTLPAADILMQSRKVAMSMDGMWKVTDFSKSGMKWGMGVLPKMEKAETVVVSNPKVIFAATKHPKEAYEFYTYISDPSQVGLFKSGLWAPLELSYYTDPKQMATWVTAPGGAFPPEAVDAVVNYTLNNTPEQAPSYWLKNIGQIMNEAIYPDVQQIVAGTETAQKAMDDAVAKATPMMQGRW
jgi:multiple sugar transport system substrate-binding protein